MLPRNLQHSNIGLPAETGSSPPETPTYRRLPSSFGVPVTTAKGYSSTRVFQIIAPVLAFTACTLPCRSPKYAVWPLFEMTTAVRTPSSASSLQYKQPVEALSEFTVPSAPPTNSFPP